MSDSTHLWRVRPDDPEYLGQAAAEAAYWNNRKGVSDFGDETADPVAVRHYNKRFTGQEDTRWYETLHEFGAFRNGLVLGAGAIAIERAILERNPNLSLTIMDISPGTLARRERELVPEFPGRITTSQADFNFLELPEQTFDFIVSSSALHHVTNLEHVAFQINQALTPEGYFFLHDYVGESQRQFSAEKKMVFELLYNRDLVRQGRPPSRLEFADDMQHSPFCGVRSGEVLGVMLEHLEEVEVRAVGALRFLLLFARDPNLPPVLPARFRLATIPGLRKVARLIRERSSRTSARTSFFSPVYMQHLLDVGDRLADAGALVPGSAFAIYRKRCGSGGK